MTSILYLPKLLPVDFCHFFTHVLLRQGDMAPRGDSQIPNAKAILDHEYMFETLHERLWPVIEQTTGEELIPTYAYARLYGNGDVLEKHKDRPACEVSITIQLGRSHHYAWPIYPGCHVEHWRDRCDGPDGYYSGQVFLHFVRKHGNYTSEAGDSTTRDNYSYGKNRSAVMECK
jgi:hypothetical protein